MPPFPELKDITPPTPPPLSSPEEIQHIVWYVYAAVVAVAALGVLWLWWRASRRNRRPPPLPLSPADEARRDLSQLRTLAPQLEAPALGQQLCEVLRRYLERRHGMLARYRTTDELLGAARNRIAPPLPFLLPFAEVLNRCDDLKFGGLDLPAAERTGLVAAALAALDSPPPVSAVPPATPPADPPAAPTPALSTTTSPPIGAGHAPSEVSALPLPPAPASVPPSPTPPADLPVRGAVLPPGPPPRPALAALRPDSFTHLSDRGSVIPI